MWVRASRLLGHGHAGPLERWHSLARTTLARAGMFVAQSPGMTRERFALEILALYALAAVGCSDDPSNPSAPDAGGGGTSPQGGKQAGGTDAATAQGGSGGRTMMMKGDACDAGALLDDTLKQCADARLDWMQSCRPRYEDTQCYVVTDGSPCLPATDPKLVEHLVDFIASAGFTPEFVIADAPGGEVPASCDKLLECCAQLPDNYLRVSCYDQVDDPKRQPYCSDWSPSRLQPNVTCPAAEADAGTPASERPRLCCYRTCGYTTAT